MRQTADRQHRHKRSVVRESVQRPRCECDYSVQNFRIDSDLVRHSKKFGSEHFQGYAQSSGRGTGYAGQNARGNGAGYYRIARGDRHNGVADARKSG